VSFSGRRHLQFQVVFAFAPYPPPTAFGFGPCFDLFVVRTGRSHCYHPLHLVFPQLCPLCSYKSLKGPPLKVWTLLSSSRTVSDHSPLGTLANFFQRSPALDVISRPKRWSVVLGFLSLVEEFLVDDRHSFFPSSACLCSSPNFRLGPFCRSCCSFLSTFSESRNLYVDYQVLPTLLKQKFLRRQSSFFPILALEDRCSMSSRVGCGE